MPTAEKASIGIDLGKTTIHAALLKDGKVIHLDKEEVGEDTGKTLTSLLSRFPSDTPIRYLGATGSGRYVYDNLPGSQLFTSSHADAAGVSFDHPELKSEPFTVIDVGGQNSLVIEAENGLDEGWTTDHSSICAAGKGIFLQQQGERLGVSLEKMGEVALTSPEPHLRVASRCGTFLKTDMVGQQAKGATIAQQLASAGDSVAQTVISQHKDKFIGRVFMVGGVSNNQSVVKSISTAINGNVEIPADAEYRGAIGAATLALEKEIGPTVLIPPVIKAEEFYHIQETLRPVVMPETWKPVEILKGTHVLVGIDVGSTSTKIAVTDLDGNVLQKIYVMTEGQPLEANKKIAAALAYLDDIVIVDAVGATGSGRNLVGNFVGADTILNEITAQGEGIYMFDPEVDTIMEIGGQDSKYIYMKNGVILNSEMNKSCAAGTGSFLAETAGQLGISVLDGKFARLAFEAPYLLDLGEKCTTFVGQSVVKALQRGEPKNVIIASLATSLAKNYKSKVIGSNPVGEHIVLTGAVFRNPAVVAAFQREFPGKKFIVPEHKEVTGAIGIARLAKKEKDALEKKTGTKMISTFKGFTSIANAPYEIRSFTCSSCENNCSMSEMKTKKSDGETERWYYGSRCDRWDSRDSTIKEKGNEKQPTPFDEREKLLYADYYPERGTGKTIGIPRALMTHDLAQLMIGFLNELGVKIKISEPTNNGTVKRSLAKASDESCYPAKLLYGHTEELLVKNVDYLMILNAIRMGKKDGEEDQHYSCPMVQAAPYIMKSAFKRLKDKLLDPVIDFSQGDKAVINSFADIAVRMDFNRKEGINAAIAGLRKQREFEQKLQEKGKELLQKLKDNPDLIGVVLLARAYNAQDRGANMGISDELEKRGVIPIPLDYLPLDEVNPKEINDRPYWNYERKILSATKIVADNPQLFGLFIGNHNCGPNSFIQDESRAVMGRKPMGGLILDDNAAEASHITRLESIVKNFQAYRASGLNFPTQPKDYRQVVHSSVKAKGEIVIPNMAVHAGIIAAAMRSYRVKARVLPQSDDRSMGLSRDVTNGTECLPYRDTVGQVMREYQDGNLKPGTALMMAGSYGPCRLGKYAGAQQKLYERIGINLQVLTTVSNNAYADLGLDWRFQLSTWGGITAIDLLDKARWRIRPYEISTAKGQANVIYAMYLKEIEKRVEGKRDLEPILKKAANDFRDIFDAKAPRKPVVFYPGEIYVRTNPYCNRNVVETGEKAGLEGNVSSVSEWIRYTNLRHVEDAIKNKNVKNLLTGLARIGLTKLIENRLTKPMEHVIFERDPSPEELLAASSPILPSRNGSEAVLTLGSGILAMENPNIDAVVALKPSGCMPGEITAAMSDSISEEYGKPWINLSLDGSLGEEGQEIIFDLGEQLNHKAHVKKQKKLKLASVF